MLAAIAFSSAAHAASLLDLSSLDYVIMSSNGRDTLGHGRYLIDRQKDAIVLRGESRYLTGEYDIEIATLSPGFPGALPTLEKFDHLFYSAGGAVTRESHANLTTALATCVEHGPDGPVVQSQTLDFPSDTWAGASVLIPIQQFLSGGGAGDLDLHVFNCTSKPSIYAVSVSVASQPSGWPYSAAGAVQVDVRPHFGWFDVFIAPFVPKLHAWFDPGDGWGFEGVAISRYYKGPQILIVRSDRQGGGSMHARANVPAAQPSESARATQPNP